tara:strand:- start:79 stop:801 length:723 start_codon:yes stop_codon:yes gene_type:complete
MSEMKLLLENWRKYLITEGAKSIEDLPDGAHIKIFNQGNEYISIEFLLGKISAPWPSSRLGDIQLYLITSEHLEPCIDGVYETHADAESGWGPFLYDVAIEYATMIGKGATSSRRGSSQDAQNVWKYYYDKRDDVKRHQMDDLKNTSSQTDADNCIQAIPWTGGGQRFLNSDTDSTGNWSPRSGEKPNSPEDVGNWSTRRRHLRNSPFSYYYTKAPTTIEKLQKLGKIKIIKDGTEVLPL